MIRPIILCGGAGTRLWPVSRALFPKQLLSLMSERSLLQDTVTRLAGEEFSPPIVVSGENQSFLIKQQLEEAGVDPEAILLEPTARNTSAAAVLAAAWTKSKGRDELLLLMPADHAILDRKAFIRAVRQGAPHAEAGAIVTFGVMPTEASTQYGYIEAETSAGPVDGAFPIARFVEKPGADKAAEYLATGHFYWNAGIFLLKTGTLLLEMRKFLPDSLDAITTALEKATAAGVFVRPEAASFERAENISIDHAIMEKTARGKVIPVQMGWSDIGSWDAVWNLGNKDTNGNVAVGDIIALDTHASLLRSEDGGPLVAAVGLDQMAVIATADAVFVSPLDRVSDVKHIVEKLKAEGRECVVSPPKVARGLGFEVKPVVIQPNERLSVQSEGGRPEHWIVIRGTAEIKVGENLSILNENESAYIPANSDLWISNSDKTPLELVRVQHESRQHDERMEDIHYGNAERGAVNRIKDAYR